MRYLSITVLAIVGAYFSVQGGYGASASLFFFAGMMFVR